jgi:hypothetical protein
MACIINLIWIIALGLSKKHLAKRYGLTNYSIVKSCAPKVVFSFAVDTTFQEGIVNSLKMLKLTRTCILRQDVEEVLTPRVL